MRIYTQFEYVYSTHEYTLNLRIYTQLEYKYSIDSVETMLNLSINTQKLGVFLVRVIRKLPSIRALVHYENFFFKVASYFFPS